MVGEALDSGVGCPVRVDEIPGRLLAWEWHPILGADLTHAGLLVILYALAFEDYLAEYRWRRHRGLIFLGLAIAADDVIEHAWGVWTPLDSLVWSEWTVPVLHWARKALSG